MATFHVVPFTAGELCTGLANRWIGPESVAAYAGADYLRRYLEALEAKTLVIEDCYTDGDFLDTAIYI